MLCRADKQLQSGVEKRSVMTALSAAAIAGNMQPLDYALRFCLAAVQLSYLCLNIAYLIS